MTHHLSRRELRIYHVQRPTPKHVENSRRGIMHAAHSPRWNAVDLDGLISKADPECPVCPAGTCRGHLMGTHWRHLMIMDGFLDPLHQIPRHRGVEELTLPELQRLEAPGGYGVPLLTAEVALCGRVGVVAVVEPKRDRRWTLDWPWQLLHSVAVTHRTDLRVRALREFPTSRPALAAARRAGIRETWLI